jgi:MFS family permease
MQRSKPLILVSLLLAAFVINLDTTIVNVALPSLVRQLHASDSQLQWVVDAFNLLFAGSVLAAGSLSDRFGRKGMLLAGPDPTGNGGVIPGFGDLREMELLVDAGFTPLEAIRIATLNGAIFMGLAERIGSIAAGKDADLLVVRGNPAADIHDVEKVETVFKDGVGFDSTRLLDSVRGRYGEY